MQRNGNLACRSQTLARLGETKQIAATEKRVNRKRRGQKEREAFFAGWGAFLDQYGELLMTDGQTDFRAGSEEAWEEFREAKAKPKAPVSEEFETACFLYQMEFSFYTFQAVQAGIAYLLQRKLDNDEAQYYPLSVGLICLYARPFTNNFPVGPLSKDIIPEQYLNLHRDIITIRNKLFAHADASVMTRPNDYPNELVVRYDGKTLNFRLTRFFAKPPFFELISPLVDELIRKTDYHREELIKRFYQSFDPSKSIGEFRLNVLDADAPILAKLTEAEKATKEGTIRPHPK